MKLNADAVREVLLYIENNIKYKDGFTHTAPLTHKDILAGIKKYSSKYTDEEIKCAIEAMLTTSFLEYAEPPKRVPSTGNLISVQIRGLTFQGYEFLTDIKNQNVWDTVKKVASQAGEFSLKTLCSVSASVAKTWIENPEKIIKVLQSAEALKDFFTHSVQL